MRRETLGRRACVAADTENDEKVDVCVEGNGEEVDVCVEGNGEEVDVCVEGKDVEAEARARVKRGLFT